jgi:hypothetical protein
MDSLGNNRGGVRRTGETEVHLRLKRLALAWAQAHGYSACAVEVGLPRCRYRADVAAYRPNGKQAVATSVFECKQALVDLRRDNGSTALTIRRLDAAHGRRETLEKNLRIHYPALRIPDSLFAEFDSHNFEKIDHRGYKNVLRQLAALQNRLFDCTKFETLMRYRCANLFLLVLPETMFRESEIPIGWGALVEKEGILSIVRKPVWHEISPENQLRLLERIAAAGTRRINREFAIEFEELIRARS